MSKSIKIETLSITGFKSIKSLDALELKPINVLIGANGSGKSNFVSFFKMLGEMMEGRLQTWTRKQGSADRIVSFGVQETDKITASIRFNLHGYDFEIEPTVDGGFVFSNESVHYDGSMHGAPHQLLGSGHIEAMLKSIAEISDKGDSSAVYCYHAISNWKVFHFHDTSDTAGVKRLHSLHDNAYLRPDASNLAAYLYRLCNEHPDVYAQIRKTVRLAIPFFDDFILNPQPLSTEEEQIRLLWSQRDSDYPFWPSQLSDGSIRFICLAAALLQPNSDSPFAIIIDEPELGLHPYAITLLGSLIRSASKQMQVIISTQSVPLVDEFSIDDLIVVEREDGASVFRRPDEQDFSDWLETYTVGELWEKNILGGRPGA
ncbi:AAA family ATPase [Bradymonas sediminis]|uniref:Recombinase RecF n=1 Tax=Bradymonas sediminis TaxID=1548548 RepID=A0A2Z4FPP8_9DELT|nr:AAA family ATPase [Bradymonas sediminis]AWV90997.1 recombinase RecF [Bradymonas sediminis]TDP75263.1 putative ATPase [Bradymonas sediminis]